MAMRSASWVRTPPPRAQAKAWEVRAFLPQAEAAEVVIDGARHADGEAASAGLLCRRSQGRAATLPPAPEAVERRRARDRGPLPLSSRCSPISNCTCTAKAPTTKATARWARTWSKCEGVEGRAFRRLGAQRRGGRVVGDFNEWDTRRHPMRLRNGGIWEIFIPGVGAGATYKYFVRSRLRRLPAAEGRPVRLRLRDAAQVRPPSCGTSTRTGGATALDGTRAPPRTG